MAGYGGFISIPNLTRGRAVERDPQPRTERAGGSLTLSPNLNVRRRRVRSRSSQPKPPAEWVRVPPTAVEIREAKDFYVGQLIDGPRSFLLVRENARKRGLRRGALTIARRNLGLSLMGGRTGVWQLPKRPTAALEAAIMRRPWPSRSSPGQP